MTAGAAERATPAAAPRGRRAARASLEDETADLLVANGIVITVDSGARVLRASVAVTGERISAIVPAGEPLPPARRTIDASRHLVIPGLVDAHDHLRNLVPGVPLATGLALDDYLKVLWTLQQHMTPEDFRLSALLGSVKLLRDGCTTVIDHAYPYHRPGIDAALLQAYRASGIRWYYARGIMTRPFRPLCEPRRAAFARIEALLDEGVPRERLMVAPVSFRQATPDDYRAARRLADRHELRLYTHIAETRDEVARSLSTFGCRPVEHLDRLGWTGDDVTLVHCVMLSAKEIARLAVTGTSVVHCPSNHMSLAKGITAVPRLLARGVSVCLGLDGMDSMLLEVRLEVLMQSLAHLDPAIVRPDTALRMATLNGARACGGEREIGSLEVGKRADLVTVAIGRLHSTPALDPVHALVHMARAGDVDTVVVDGRVAVAGGAVQGIDEDALAAEVQKTARRYLERAGHGDLLPAYLP